MAEIFPSLNGATYQLPLTARQVLAANMQDASTVEGAALNNTIVAVGAKQFAQVIGVPAGSSAAQINAAIASAGDADVVRLYGTYTTTATILVTSHLDARGATINYSGTGVAVQIGAGSGALVLYKQIIAPQVFNVAKTTLGWAQVVGSVGIRIVNANTCNITMQKVRNFETQLDVRGESAGCVYNTIAPGHMSNGFYSFRFTADATGWVNQNTFVGGRVDMDSGEGDRVAGTRFVLIENTANATNGNTWFGTALEGNGAEYSIEAYGQYNVWVGCRFEASLGSRVWWRAGATRNAIMQGYGAPVVTTEAGALRNEVSQAGSRKDVTVSSTGGVFNLQNDSSGAAPAWTVMDPGTPISTNDPATKYVWAASALLLKGKRAADSNDRVQVDASNGRIAFGDGTAAPAAYLAFDSASLLKIIGASLFPSVHNTQDLGINTTRWRYVRAGTALMTGTFATASRPTAAIGAGAMIYDTTLNKPVWSDGTNWRDATGTVV